MDSWYKPTREQRKKYLQEQAEAQKEAWGKLTTMQKIQTLDERLGPNAGAVKERAKLKVLLGKEYEAQEAKELAKERAKLAPKKKVSAKK
ncbi:hypothetical protein LCGC14_0469820 [marine sediment metagenome]|uniref:Uncharacterized protein n=1 Tax=marine sediment metagenome TaxID=412755 RepID=A0A0F9SVH8_9ZZZZ